MLTKASENEIALEANYFKLRTWLTAHRPKRIGDSQFLVFSTKN